MTTLNPIKRPIEKVLTVLILISIIILSLPQETKLKFTNQASNIFLYPTIFITSRLIELRLLNRDLTAINDKLNKTIIELNRLRLTKNIFMISNTNLIPGLVTMRDKETQVRFLTINKGRNNGIRVAMPAVFEGHLIGKVVDVNSNQSIIETIFNPGFRVSVLHQNSKTNGILETTRDRIEIKYFPRNIQIKTGDTILTSGVGSFAPPGLLIGKIDVVKPGEGLFFQGLNLLPFKNIGGLDHIYILTSK